MSKSIANRLKATREPQAWKDLEEAFLKWATSNWVARHFEFENVIEDFLQTIKAKWGSNCIKQTTFRADEYQQFSDDEYRTAIMVEWFIAVLSRIDEGEEGAKVLEECWSELGSQDAAMARELAWDIQYARSVVRPDGQLMCKNNACNNLLPITSRGSGFAGSCNQCTTQFAKKTMVPRLKAWMKQHAIDEAEPPFLDTERTVAQQTQDADEQSPTGSMNDEVAAAVKKAQAAIIATDDVKTIKRIQAAIWLSEVDSRTSEQAIRHHNLECGERTLSRVASDFGFPKRKSGKRAESNPDKS